jgi:hypothetical protein
MRSRVKTVCVDFDGVIHAYSHGWQDGSIYDSPLPGAIEALEALMTDYAVIVHTTRDPQQVAPWLLRYGFDVATYEPDEFWNERGTLLVTRRKYPAVAYIDDRAIRFVNWQQTVTDLVSLTTRVI